MIKIKLKKSKILLITILVISLFTLSSCGNLGASDESTLEKAKRQGYVTVGFANEKPYAYQTADGELTGESVEVARAVLKNLGIEEMRGELTEFGSLVPGLQAKRFDMITAGMYIKPDRAKQVAFANPEYSVGVALGVKKGNPLGLNSYEDIANHDTATIAVPGGAIEYKYLIESGVEEERITTVPDMPSALSALQSGRVDAITATGPSLQSTLDTADDPNIERVENFTPPVIDGESIKDYGATAFRHEDQDFVEAFNKELQKLKDSGELLEIIKEFGFTEDELPGDVTTEEILNR
ncbi:ectoine/hydroxyectoine ABC transporter substrate-binding protein EhuB [Schnuerera sp. xch1]|uniref:ectoine/hydroxyectoine ABC transporter substrate-binding protein EhuB n=1 Tax=Schnuerera sp. xch1 TaxID=2874283 RepID=UPI001CBE5F06|nr:ectoine/hydroxyectoine ABC transporter substrate-binding protein EhuB [Schnuerera sp. xch1]MBZ2175460.1 ectoine/hydroxyectoine ABC transporter substrate-binding protein EhuB [Schnuerera sp. xch1]